MGSADEQAASDLANGVEVEDLFQRSDPGRFRLVIQIWTRSWSSGRAPCYD